MLQKILIPLAIALTILGLLIWAFLLIWRAGFSRVVHDWSTDKTGKHVIGNGFRIIAFFFLMLITLATSFEVTLKPFHVKPLPMPAEVLLIWLAWIGGESLIAWLRNKVPSQDTTVKVESETTNIGPVNPKQEPVKPVVVVEDIVIPKDKDVLKAETKPDRG